MKNRIALPTKIVSLIMFAQLLGCHKFIDIKDAWHQHNPDCRIEKITYYPDVNSDSAIASFQYNKKGNPVHISFQGAAYPPDYFFQYDAKDRLTDYFDAFPNGTYISWRRYLYDNSGRIIADTTNGFGVIIAGKPVPNDEFKWHTVYEYDAFDRIKKTTARQFAGPGLFIDSFVYNSAGNLAAHWTSHNGSTPIETRYESHDNKVSIFRTNKLWMFLGSNYSRNNLDRAEAYNSSGLPLRFEVPGFVNRPFIGQIQMRQSTIEYRCR